MTPTVATITATPPMRSKITIYHPQQRMILMLQFTPVSPCCIARRPAEGAKRRGEPAVRAANRRLLHHNVYAPQHFWVIWPSFGVHARQQDRGRVMPDMRHTDIQLRDPSTLQERIDAARRQAECEVAEDEYVVHLRIGDRGTQMGDDSMLWWPVTYEVTRKRPLHD
jgi:hypothetical protein